MRLKTRFFERLKHLCRRSRGGLVNPAQAALIWEQGMEESPVTIRPTAHQHIPFSQCHVTINIRGIHDPQRFVRSQSEIKQAVVIALEHAQRIYRRGF